jgi:hypothetical protein
MHTPKHCYSCLHYKATPEDNITYACRCLKTNQLIYIAKQNFSWFDVYDAFNEGRECMEYIRIEVIR